jgi:hypothetical protein
MREGVGNAEGRVQKAEVKKGSRPLVFTSAFCTLPSYLSEPSLTVGLLPF